jgi:hypothetical protein
VKEYKKADLERRKAGQEDKQKGRNPAEKLNGDSRGEKLCGSRKEWQRCGCSFI